MANFEDFPPIFCLTAEALKNIHQCRADLYKKLVGFFINKFLYILLSLLHLSKLLIFFY